MGLRIKERHTEPQRIATVQERLSEVERESRAWFEQKGQPREHVEFMQHVRSAYRLLGDGEPVGDMLGRIKEQILASNSDSALSHNRVDIATLLTLL